MKLYYSPGACSHAPHIVLRELGLVFDLDKINIRGTERKTQDGADYYTINPTGYVPALQLDDGRVLTEVGAIIPFLADQKPEANLAPRPGSFERTRLRQWLNFIATELHKNYSPMFRPGGLEEEKAAAIERLEKRYGIVRDVLKNRDYILGDSFTVADAYLYTVLRWARMLELAPPKWPELAAYIERIESRPAVQAAIEAEGL